MIIVIKWNKRKRYERVVNATFLTLTYYNQEMKSLGMLENRKDNSVLILRNSLQIKVVRKDNLEVKFFYLL